MNYQVLLIILAIFISFNCVAQTDSIPKQSSFSGLPAITSSPETGVTFGGLLLHNFNLAKDDPFHRQSQMQYVFFYTTKNQLLAQMEWQLFTKDSKYNIFGEIEYNKWTDRLYKQGNVADALILEYNDGMVDSLNYMNFGLNLWEVKLDFMRRIRPNLFVGIAVDYLSSSNFQILADSVVDVNNDLVTANAVGQRMGLGVKMSYDSRKYLGNPLNAWFIQFSMLNYSNLFGGDYEYNLIRLDVRKYINTTKNHTLALRVFSDQRLINDNDPLPFYGAASIGGRGFVRGYFQSTFYDNNVLAFEAEYRLPFWKENLDTPFWKIWKRLGMVAFVSSAKAYPDWSTFGDNDFHLSTGLGLRILVNSSQRTAIRADYGFGLTKNANGVKGRQRGLYLSINEAF